MDHLYHGYVSHNQRVGPPNTKFRAFFMGFHVMGIQGRFLAWGRDHGHFFEATPREHWMVYFRENPNIDDNWE